MRTSIDGWASGRARRLIWTSSTPATGRRLLCHPEADRTGTEPAVWAGLRHLADAADASSVYTIQLNATSTYGCADSTSHEVEVHATPIADIEVLDQAGCYPLEVTFGNQSVGGEAYIWSYGTGLNSDEPALEHTVEYFNPTSNVLTYAAVLTASTSAGCSSQDVAYIEVLPQVNAHIEGGFTGCAPLEVDFLNLSDGAASYTWDFGDGGQSATAHASHAARWQGARNAMQRTTNMRVEPTQLRIRRHARVMQLHQQLQRSRQPGAWLSVSRVRLQAANAQRLF